MKKIIIILVLLSMVLNNFSPSYAESSKKKKNHQTTINSPGENIKVRTNKNFNMVEVKSATTTTQAASVPSGTEELIPVNVKNEFNEEIKVKLDTNREYPVGPHEWITLGKRKPGRYTLTIYNKDGDFVDNLTKNIDNKNKFVLSENTISNSSRIEDKGLSTGKKVAIGAAAVGAAAVGAALLNKAIQAKNEQAAHQAQYAPVQQVAAVPQGVVVDTTQGNEPSLDNAFAPNGKPVKFLNTKYDKVTVIVEGTDGKPIGNNWIIPKAPAFQKPQPLILSDEKIKIASDQTIKAVLPTGIQLQRNAFELDTDPFDGSYIWVVK